MRRTKSTRAASSARTTPLSPEARAAELRRLAGIVLEAKGEMDLARAQCETVEHLETRTRAAACQVVQALVAGHDLGCRELLPWLLDTGHQPGRPVTSADAIRWWQWFVVPSIGQGRPVNPASALRNLPPAVQRHAGALGTETTPHDDLEHARQRAAGWSNAATWASDALEGAAVSIGQPAATAHQESAAKPPAGITKMAYATSLRASNPDWTDKEIAKKAGVSAGTLSRNQHYRAVRRATCGDRKNRAAGFTRHEQTPEAIAPDQARYPGQPAGKPGLYWERCADCEEWIKVLEGDVGQNPVCEGCKRL